MTSYGLVANFKEIMRIDAYKKGFMKNAVVVMNAPADWLSMG